MHHLCSRTKWSRFHGTNVEKVGYIWFADEDFVEAPSQMLENWCWQSNSLRRLSSHYKTGEPIPDELIEKIVRAKQAGAGLFNLRQLFFGVFDMRLHGSEEEKVDTTTLFNNLCRDISLIEAPKGSFGQAAFGHMIFGYDAGYYGYMWSKVYSSDMFYTKFSADPLDSAVGNRYRRKILERGGSWDAMDMVRDFLGRDPLPDAFMREDIGAAGTISSQREEDNRPFTMVTSGKFRYKSKRLHGAGGDLIGIVERDIWALKKPGKGKKKHVKDVDEWILSDAVEIVEKRREAIVDSKFHRDFQGTELHARDTSLQCHTSMICTISRTGTGILHNHLIPTHLHDIVCYGVGSMHQSRNAQFQFALMLIMRETLQVCSMLAINDDGKVYIFDPVMTHIDRQLLEHYGVELISENEQAKRAVHAMTLFYMPHCNKVLYSNLLSANWNAQALEKVVIIGNRFGLYVESQTDSHLRREAPYMILAVPLVACTPLPTEFDNNMIFNDLCVHIFERRRLRAVDSGFWTVTLKVDGNEGGISQQTDAEVS
ncbi:peptidase family M3-domain-containing protein [Jimgerdemannia flammicorona]|uniref:Peptidase family M3-domain-containing protein n=1 Tax=Jimgerdemannia flammicorona TaxID=994334 RepID=A0A433D614_9FUNG|nr:peptidase family M3-domain-containing protein [Jimgerdemannia flammicorona]